MESVFPKSVHEVSLNWYFGNESVLYNEKVLIPKQTSEM